MQKDSLEEIERRMRHGQGPDAGRIRDNPSICMHEEYKGNLQDLYPDAQDKR